MADSMGGITVYNLPHSKPNWDRIGVFYISWCVAWTTCLLLGLGFLWLNRNVPILKIRGLPLALGAILFLHCYWILAQLVYPIGATMSVTVAYSVQYFFMGIWFPLGVAMFHASNLRFLHIAKRQRRFANAAAQPTSGCNGGKTSWLCRIRNLPYITKIMVFIGTAMVLQVLVTTAMWLACSKYHPSFGIPGTGLTSKTIPGQLTQMGRGWEWWPSVLWQVIWTWIVAPYLIWKAWGIRDTMGWRVQTIGCCISNLHATPMFLVAQYVPVFEKVNRYFTPSQWIHLSIFMFEVFTVFVPLFQVARLWIMRKKSLAANAEWSRCSRAPTLMSLQAGERKKHAKLSIDDKAVVVDFTDEEMGDRLLTMSALDHVLSENPTPLQEFSALKDFSGENVAFLIRATEWKATFSGPMSEEKRSDAYDRALWIYIDFISPRDAEFPLNLSSQDLKRFEDIFERAARIVCGEALVNPATPFDIEQPSGSGGIGSHHSSGWANPKELNGRIRYTGVVPPQFGINVFDRAHGHIKYLVLTNTWPKFVAEIQSRRRSSEAGRSIFTHFSEATLASRITSRLSRLTQPVT